MLTAGVGLSAVCFIVAGVAELLGSPVGSGMVRDLEAVVAGLGSADPWAWASLGTLVVLITPGLGLLVTAFEYARVSDRRTTLMALAVVTVLVVSGVVAFLR
jgi:uncharacterized membrane protein